jgi:hypothetical protein
VEQTEEAQEEFGWKLVHGDVFRPPANPMLLAVFLGSGSQILIMVVVTLLFACLGFLSPATRGGSVKIVAFEMVQHLSQCGPQSFWTRVWRIARRLACWTHAYVATTKAELYVPRETDIFSSFFLWSCCLENAHTHPTGS